MVVVAVGGSAGPGAGCWGTWEELILGCAVERHGGAAWAAVADELRIHTPFAFSPEECEAKFAEIQARYSACNALSEELKKQRVAELKRGLVENNNNIGYLLSKVESLSNSKDDDSGSDCRTNNTESCSHSGNTANTNLSSKELSRDRSSAASFTEEASNCQKSQQVQRCDNDLIQANNTSAEEPFLKAVDEKACAKDSFFWGSRKQRGKRAGRILPKADANSRDGEPTSIACAREGSAEGGKDLKHPIVVSGEMKKGLKDANVESGAAKKVLKTSNSESGAMKKVLKTPNEPALLKRGLTTPSVESSVTKKRLKTPNAESVVMKKGLKTPNVGSDVIKNVLKTPNAESGVMKNSLKNPTVESGVSVIEREKPNLTDILNSVCLQGDCLMLQRQVDAQRKLVGYKKVIRRHMDFRTLHSKIKSGAISSAEELLRDLLIFVNNVIAFYPKDTLEHKAAVELRDIAYKTVNQGANVASQSGGATGTSSATTVKKNAQATGTDSATTVKKNAQATGTDSAAAVKKNAQAMQPGRPGPGDAKGSKVPAREATASSRQGVGKDSHSDKPPAANSKTVQKSEPAKKRGVGRPPKSATLKRNAAPAQEDSPSKGRKRTRR
ncbi:hypothetical protein EJB05_11766 [Eragrostis curvula]|uniref:Bromo domain-containing protein n=1 Tax=Eragrostis curvula TaxID=38414 RepID=A0A5J9VRE3_9POAL|nr:hypothetical protein EJB05_11766 [Eragrostis curvula]